MHPPFAICISGISVFILYIHIHTEWNVYFLLCQVRWSFSQLPAIQFFDISTQNTHSPITDTHTHTEQKRKKHVKRTKREKSMRNNNKKLKRRKVKYEKKNCLKKIYKIHPSWLWRVEAATANDIEVIQSQFPASLSMNTNTYSRGQRCQYTTL